MRRSGMVPGPVSRAALLFLLLGVHSGLAAPGAAVGQSGPVARLHELVNDHRDLAACPPLAWHAPSATVAEERSADMVRRRYFDHRTPDGRTVFDEVADAGIEAHGSIAENIALTRAGPASVMELWRESPPHRRNLDDCSFTHHGLGERDGVWTQILLARPKPAAPRGGAKPVSPRPPPTPRD